MSIPFDTIYKEFEDTKDICAFCEKYKKDNVATRFLLIRSLDKSHLQDIISEYSSESATGVIRELTQKAYNSPVTIKQLLSYIEEKRPAIVKKREAELEGLSDMLANFPVVNCGVRNDKVDDIIKNVVRDKSIKTCDQLENIIDHSVLPRIRQYMLWSYYNQNANDIIELFFLRHPKVIPTLRKIHDIDFFVNIDNTIIPFDLKFTHISDEYFDLYSEDIIDCTQKPTIYDDYDTYGNKNELKQIKAFYSSHKKGWKLPNYGKMSKTTLLDTLIETQKTEALEFINDLLSKRETYVKDTIANLQPLEWWNYKFQGERLFCNNNRFFVFLAYTRQFTDGRALKGKTAEIGEKINTLLDNLSAENIHHIHYHYDKQANLTSDYSALSISTIYTE